MVTVLIIGYIACVLAAFKIIRIKVNPVTVAVSVLGGIFLIGGVVIAWKFSAPITGKMTVIRRTVPLLSGQDSKELITKVHVAAHQMVKKGDVLYEVDQRPTQYALDSLTAQLAVAEQTISELEAGIEVAAATVEAAKAGLGYSKAQVVVAEGIQKANPAAVAALKVTVQENKYASSQAAVEQAIAAQKEAEFALTNAKENLKATQAQIETAKLNLEQCFIRAPADGYIMNWQAVEGTMTTTVITSAQGVFMDMSETVVAAVLPQNLVKNVAPGDEVEFAFKSTPGRIATGKVSAVVEYTGEGQLEPSGVVPVVATLGSKGFLVVRIKLDDEDLARELPLGGAGTTAIYTKVGGPFHVISKIVVRMKAWTNYAF
jgi:multidrug resistance efflux pump